MTTQSSRRALQLRLWALFMFFFIPGLLMASSGHPHAGDPRSVGAIHRRDGRGAVWSVGGVDERYSLLGVAGEALWHPQVIRTTMSFAVLGMLVLSPALWVTSAPLFAFGLGHLRRQLWLCRSRY